MLNTILTVIVTFNKCYFFTILRDVIPINSGRLSLNNKIREVLGKLSTSSGEFSFVLSSIINVISSESLLSKTTNSFSCIFVWHANTSARNNKENSIH